jgi:hypothetical protein
MTKNDKDLRLKLPFVVQQLSICTMRTMAYHQRESPKSDSAPLDLRHQARTGQSSAGGAPGGDSTLTAASVAVPETPEQVLPSPLKSAVESNFQAPAIPKANPADSSTFQISRGLCVIVNQMRFYVNPELLHMVRLE